MWCMGGGERHGGQSRGGEKGMKGAVSFHPTKNHAAKDAGGEEGEGVGPRGWGGSGAARPARILFPQEVSPLGGRGLWSPLRPTCAPRHMTRVWRQNHVHSH